MQTVVNLALLFKSLRRHRHLSLCHFPSGKRVKPKESLNLRSRPLRSSRSRCRGGSRRDRSRSRRRRRCRCCLPPHTLFFFRRLLRRRSRREMNCGKEEEDDSVGGVGEERKKIMAPLVSNLDATQPGFGKIENCKGWLQQQLAALWFGKEKNSLIQSTLELLKKLCVEMTTLSPFGNCVEKFKKRMQHAILTKQYLVWVEFITFKLLAFKHATAENNLIFDWSL